MTKRRVRDRLDLIFELGNGIESCRREGVLVIPGDQIPENLGMGVVLVLGDKIDDGSG